MGAVSDAMFTAGSQFLQGAALNQQASDSMNQSIQNIGAARRQDRQLDQQDSIIAMQKSDYEAKGKEMSNKITNDWVAGATRLAQAADDVEKNLATTIAQLKVIASARTPQSMDTLAQGVSPKDPDVIEGNEAPVVEQDDPKFVEVYNNAEAEFKRLTILKQNIQNQRQTSILRALRDPKMVASLINSDYNNSALVDIYQKGFANADPKIQAEAADYLNQAMGAVQQMEEMRANSEFQGTLNKERIFETQKAEIEANKQVDIHNRTVALKELSSQQSLADKSVAAQTANAVVPEAASMIFDVKENGDLDIDENNLWAKNLVSAKENIAGMTAGSIMRDQTVYDDILAQSIDFTSNEFDPVVFKGLIADEKTIKRFSSPNSGFLTVLNVLGESMKDTGKGSWRTNKSAAENFKERGKGLLARAKSSREANPNYGLRKDETTEAPTNLGKRPVSIKDTIQLTMPSLP